MDNVYGMIKHYDIPVIQTGDHNIALDPSKDRAGDADYQAQKRHALLSLMSAVHLVDIWRLKNPDPIRYSWRRNASASRIDFFSYFFLFNCKRYPTNNSRKISF